MYYYYINRDKYNEGRPFTKEPCPQKCCKIKNKKNDLLKNAQLTIVPDIESCDDVLCVPGRLWFVSSILKFSAQTNHSEFVWTWPFNATNFANDGTHILCSFSCYQNFASQGTKILSEFRLSHKITRNFHLSCRRFTFTFEYVFPRKHFLLAINSKPGISQRR